MEENIDMDSVELFDTGELSSELIPPSFTDPDVLFQVLIKTIKGYHPSNDLAIINKAYDVAKQAHKDQKRKSGEPYLIHPVCVAIILAQLEMDKETIVGALLHDVIEDTVFTREDIVELFSEEIAVLVDGVTKLTNLNYSTDKLDMQAENLRKMFMAMSQDIRVLVIKLADRLHNMRTLDFMKPEKQKEKSRETMDIYAPLADRLGISKVKVELDDLSLKYLEPEAYEQLSDDFDAIKISKEDFIKDLMKEVGEKMEENGLKVKIDGRVKHLFSIYKKMTTQDKTLDQIYDLFAIRIIVDTDQECYTALGLIHDMFTPIPGRFKDYIAMPKPNKYQSLHTTLIGHNGQPFEIQIRTHEMHKTAEFGIAAHWKYKEGNGKSGAQGEKEKDEWLVKVIEWQKEMDNREFLSSVKDDFDLFSDRIYCFTPGGDVKNLPAGSTPIDFAYSVHSAVGNQMVGARVNGNIVKMDYKIQNGDRIDIITSQNSRGPSRDWLTIVKSSSAKNKINQWFRTQFKEENVIKGKELLHTYCKTKAIDLAPLLKPEITKVCMSKYGFMDWESVCAAIGHGGLKEGQVVSKLQDIYERKNKKHVAQAKVDEMLEKAGDSTVVASASGPTRYKNKSGIVVEGMHDLAVRFTRCCNPVPGDEIIGFVTRGRGVAIHRTDCVNIINLPSGETNRLIEAEWSDEAKSSATAYPVEIVIYSYNRSGLLLDLTKIFTENNIDVKSLNVRTTKQERATLSIGFETTGTNQLDKLITKLKEVESVIDIERSTN